MDDIASTSAATHQATAPTGADDDPPSAVSATSNPVSRGGNSNRAHVVNFSLAPKLDHHGSFLLEGKTSRLSVEKLLQTVTEIEEHMAHVVKQAMVGTTKDRLSYAACKCEDVRREMIEAIKTLKSVLGEHHNTGTGNGSGLLVVPPLAFKESLLNEIAILTGSNARLKFD